MNKMPTSELRLIPFKDQKSANALRHQLSDLSRKIDAVAQPVYVSIYSFIYLFIYLFIIYYLFIDS